MAGQSRLTLARPGGRGIITRWNAADAGFDWPTRQAADQQTVQPPHPACGAAGAPDAHRPVHPLLGPVTAGIFFRAITPAVFGAIVVVLWQGARQGLNGTLTQGGLTQFILYTMFIAAAIGGLYMLLHREQFKT